MVAKEAGVRVGVKRTTTHSREIGVVLVVQRQYLPPRKPASNAVLQSQQELAVKVVVVRVVVVVAKGVIVGKAAIVVGKDMTVIVGHEAQVHKMCLIS